LAIRYFTAFLLAAGLTACASGATTSAPVTASAPPTTIAKVSVDTAAASVPNTAVPTTAVPTTAVPTTAVSTTVAPTTVVPTSPSPSTGDALKDRPFEVFVPTTYDKATAMPLVVLLHGYTVNGAIQEAYFKLTPLAEERGFLYVHPDGTKDAIGNGFWNATDGCCDFLNTGVDDSGYLAALVRDVQSKYTVDPKRIFFIGHSNGGFMSYRMACDHADVVAGIVAVAGATWADVSKCAPSQPVSIMSVHGTADATIKFDGGQNFGRTYPSAATTMSTWAKYDGCSATPVVSATKLDLEVNVAGDETVVSDFPDCAGGAAVELRTVIGGPHTPAITPQFFSDAIDFLFAHPKP
jgi:polyhydroxybutyrate depolymerase